MPGVIITEPGAVSWDADLLDASARGLENLGLTWIDHDYINCMKFFDFKYMFFIVFSIS